MLPVLDRLFDDAGLFPPASHPMAEALAIHERTRTGPHRRLVGPFICPVARMDEMDACVAGGVPRPPELSLVTYQDGPQARRALLRTGVVQVEAPLGTVLPEEALRVRRYFELPPSGDVQPMVDELVRLRARAKVRCGGLTPDAVPPPARLAEVLVACARRRLPLKATAGLHHPFRHYEAELGGHQHGFVNLLAAASAAVGGAASTDVEGILVLEQDEAEAVLGRIDRHARELLVSIGSCSIDEPVADLQALRLL